MRGIRKRILYLIPRYVASPGGINYHAREMILSLKDRFDISIIRHCSVEPSTPEVAIARNEGLRLEYDEGVAIYHTGVPSGMRRSLEYLGSRLETSRSARIMYRRLLRKAIGRQMFELARDCDVIHAVSSGLADSMEMGFEAAKMLKVPFIFTPATDVSDRSGRSDPGARVRKKLLKGSDALIAVNDLERQRLVETGVHEGRVQLCPQWPVLSERFDGARFRAHHNIGNVPMVLFVGRQDDSKGYKSLCASAEHVWAYHPDTRFVFLGPGTEESRIFFARSRDRRILNLGVVSIEEKTSAIAACDLLCVLSAREKTGVAYVEAWAMGKPVVAADTPLMRRLVRDNVDGVLVGENVLELADAVVDLISRPALRTGMGREGREKALRLYDRGLLREGLCAVYDGLLS